MRAPDDTSAGRSEPPNQSTAVLLLGTIADTTWRMFVPTVGLLLAGLWGDNQLGSTPWLMITGLLAGIAISTELIRRQLINVKKS